MKKHGVVFQILMSALSIVGAIVGIGFVSGKEIVSFFWRYQGLGFLLAFLSSLGLFFCVFFGAMRAKKLKQITERNLITDNQNFGDQNCDSGARFDDGKSKFDELNNQVINGCKNCKNESFGLKKCVKNENNDNINKSTVINNFDNKDCGRNNINLNNEKHDQVLKNRKINNKNIKKHIKYANIKDKFAKIYDCVIGCMQVVILGCMMAGIAELLDAAGIDEYILKVLFLVLVLGIVFVLFVCARKYVLKVSGWMTFALIVLMMVCLLIAFFSVDESNVIYVFDNSKSNVFAGVWSCVFYVSMNMLSATGQVENVGKTYNHKKYVLLVALASSAVLFFMIFLILSVFDLYPQIVSYSMPLLMLAKLSGDALYFVYFGGLFLGSVLALLSVCYSACVSLDVDLEFASRSSYLKVLFVLLIGFCVSFVGFDLLIDYVYPLIGLLFLVLCVSRFFVRVRSV